MRSATAYNVACKLLKPGFQFKANPLHPHCFGREEGACHVLVRMVDRFLLPEHLHMPRIPLQMVSPFH